jgi:ParB-like chromosome segregation protein Spo0J
MRPLDESHIDLLSRSDPERWPPILVALRPNLNRYVVVDGNHRVAAALQANIQLIRATPYDCPDDNRLVETAFRANFRHGLPASVATRGDYAFWLSVTYPNLTQEELAKRSGLSQGAVSKAIAKRLKELQEANAPTAEDTPQDTTDDPRKQRKAIKRFVQEIARFTEEVGTIEDHELATLLADQFADQRATLVRLSRLLAYYKN